MRSFPHAPRWTGCARPESSEDRTAAAAGWAGWGWLADVAARLGTAAGRPADDAAAHPALSHRGLRVDLARVNLDDQVRRRLTEITRVQRLARHGQRLRLQLDRPVAVDETGPGRRQHAHRPTVQRQGLALGGQVHHHPQPRGSTTSQRAAPRRTRRRAHSRESVSSGRAGAARSARGTTSSISACGSLSARPSRAWSASNVAGSCGSGTSSPAQPWSGELAPPARSDRRGQLRLRVVGEELPRRRRAPTPRP